MSAYFPDINYSSSVVAASLPGWPTGIWRELGQGNVWPNHPRKHHGYPKERGIVWARKPDLMRRSKQLRADWRIGLESKERNVDKPNQPTRSYLFTVRLWVQDADSAQLEWRGLVQYVPSGEYHYFKSWPALNAFFTEVLFRPQTKSSAQG